MKKYSHVAESLSMKKKQKKVFEGYLKDHLTQRGMIGMPFSKIHIHLQFFKIQLDAHKHSQNCKQMTDLV